MELDGYIVFYDGHSKRCVTHKEVRRLCWMHKVTAVIAVTETGALHDVTDQFTTKTKGTHENL